MINWQIFLLILGGGWLGSLLVWLDKVIYVYILYPEAQLSQHFKYLMEKHQLGRALSLLKQRDEEIDKLPSRGILFQIAWVILAIFAMTSTAGYFGQAVVMGMGIRILVAEWQGWLGNKQDLKEKLLWQVKRTMSDSDLKIYLGIKTVVVIWLISLFF